MNIKILGPGCSKCKVLERMTREAVAELGIEATIEHVTETDKILAYPIVTTPALVVDGEVKVSGHLPTSEQLRGWLA
jgi:small redox-active disulfide protein 2